MVSEYGDIATHTERLGRSLVVFGKQLARCCYVFVIRRSDWSCVRRYIIRKAESAE